MNLAFPVLTAALLDLEADRKLGHTLCDPDYLPTDGFTTLNMVSSIGVFLAWCLGAVILCGTCCAACARRTRHGGRPMGLRQLPEIGDQLPGAAAQLHRIVRIGSERPAFEFHYPHMARRMRAEAHIAGHRHLPAPSEITTARTFPAHETRDPDPGNPHSADAEVVSTAAQP